MKFNEYKGLDLANIANEVLKKWDADDTFHKSITTREGHPTFVFYEGPPSANGMPYMDREETAHGWNGKVAMVRIYDEAYTQDQIIKRRQELQSTIDKLNTLIAQ